MIIAIIALHSLHKYKTMPDDSAILVIYQYNNSLKSESRRY